MAESITTDQPITLNIPILNPAFQENFEILEVAKEEDTCSNLVVEDRSYGDILFLKRRIFTDTFQYEHSKEYYNILEEFSQSNFSPMDMIKIAQVLTYSKEDCSQHELLVFYEWGEPDCIDLDRLTNQQTLKFLKNICDILKTTYIATKLTHNNIK